MRTSVRLSVRGSLLALSVLAAACAPVRAATLTWDANTATAGIQDGAGTWDNTLADFSDGISNFAWTNGSNVAVFGNNGAGGTVVLSTPITAGGLTFNSGVSTFYSLTGSGLTIGSSGIVSTLTSGTTFIADALTLGSAQSWNIGAGGTLTESGSVSSAVTLTVTGSGNTVISGNISGAGGITKTGTGTLTLSGVNSYSGNTTFTLNTLGTIQIQGTSAMSPNSLFSLGNGTILQLRADANGTFTAKSLNPGGGSTITIDVNQLSGAGGNNVFTLVSTGAIAVGGNAVTMTMNVTGGNNDSLILQGTVNFTNNVNNGWFLNPTTANLTVAGPVNGSNNGQIFTLGGTASSNFVSGAITSLLNVVKSNTSTWTLQGVNTYTGSTAVNGGTLIYTGTVGVATATGAFSVGVAGGGNAMLVVQPTATIKLANANLAIGASTTGASVGQGFVYQTGGTISGVNQLLIGNATTAANAYGYYNMSGGTLGVNEVNIGGLNGASLGVLDMSGGTMNVSGWFLPARGNNSTGIVNQTGGSIVYTGGSTQFALNLFSTGAAELGVVSIGRSATSPATFTAAGATLDLMQSGVSGQLGIVNLLPGGTLQVQGVKATNNAGTSNFNFNGGTLKASTANTAFLPNSVTTVNVFAGGGTLDNNGVNITVDAGFSAPAGSGVTSVPVTAGGSGYQGSPVVTFSGGGGVGATGYATIVNGSVTGIIITSPGTGYSSAPTVTLTGGGGVGASLDVAALAANISGSMTFAGVGTTTLSGNSTYTGSTIIKGGKVSVSGSIDGSGGITVNTGGAFALSGYISTGSPVPVVVNGGTATFTGSIPTLGAVSVSAGTATFNSYLGTTGSISVTGGAFVATTLNASGAGPVTVANGTFAGSGSTDSAVTLNTGGILSPGNAGTTATLTVGRLTTGGGGSIYVDLVNSTTVGSGVNDLLAVTGNASFSGVTTLAIYPGAAGLTNGDYTLLTYGGTLTGSGANFALSGALSSGTTRQSGVIKLSTPGSIILTISGNPGTLTYTGAVSSVWNLSTLNFSNNGSSDHFYNLDQVTFSDAGAGNISIPGSVAPGSLTINAAANYTFSGAGKITGTTGLIKQGGGSLTLATLNDYTGATTLSGGVVAITSLGDAGVAGNLGAATASATNITIDGSTLQYTGTGESSNRLFTISGNGGTLNSSGSGPLILTNTGVIPVNGGTVTLTGSAGTIASPNVIAGALTDGGYTSLLVTGSGAWSLTAANTFNGGADIEGGTLITPIVANTGTASGIGLGNAGLTINGGKFVYSGTAGGVTNVAVVLGGSGGTLASSNAANVVINGVISGDGKLSVTGNGSLTLTNTNSYTGGTEVFSGSAVTSSGGGSNSLFGPAGSNVIIHAGAEFDSYLYGFTYYNFTIAGTGVAGGGAIHKGYNAPTWNTGTVTLTGDTLLASDGGANQYYYNTVNKDASVAGTSLTLGGGGGGAFYGGATLGTGSVLVTGGYWSFAGTGSWTGTTTVNANATLGVLSSTAVPGDITDNGTVNFDINVVPSTTTYGGLISGSGSVTIGNQGDGFVPTVVLTNASNSFTGNVNVLNANFTITSAGALGAGTKTLQINNNANGGGQQRSFFHLDGSAGSIVLPATISLLTSNTAGTIYNDAGDNTINGSITMTAGGGNTTIVSNGGSLTLAGVIAPSSGLSRALTLDGTALGFISGAIQNNGTGLASVVKAGTGTWTLTGANTYTGGTTVNAGTLISSGLPTTAASGASVILNGGKLVIQHATLDHALAAVGSSYLTFAGGKIDLGNRDVLVSGGAAGAAQADAGMIAPYLTTVGGHSVYVTTAVETSAVYALLRGPTATFDGATLGTSDLLLRYSFAGDVNLDGLISIDDYLAIDAGFVEGLSGYANGDFNHDGSINAADYALIDFNAGAKTTLGAGEIALHTSEFGSEYVLALDALSSPAAVPEPASLVLLASGAALLLGRKRR